MIKYILILGGICFSMLGLAEFLHGLKAKILSPGKKGVTYAVIFLNGDDPAGQIAFAAEQRIWLGNGYADHIIAVNSGLEENDYALCRETAVKYGVIYCRADELAEKTAEFMPL